MGLRAVSWAVTSLSTICKGPRALLGFCENDWGNEFKTGTRWNQPALYCLLPGNRAEERVSSYKFETFEDLIFACDPFDVVKGRGSICWSLCHFSRLSGDQHTGAEGWGWTQQCWFKLWENPDGFRCTLYYLPTHPRKQCCHRSKVYHAQSLMQTTQPTFPSTTDTGKP